MSLKQYGIDVSHFQSAAAMPWQKIAETSSFVIARATYGTSKDKQTLEHCKRARDVGLSVGLYLFFRPTQHWADQLDAFAEQASAAKFGLGDIWPALDIEADPYPKPGQAVSPAWQEGIRQLLELWRVKFGGALVYITQREFGMLGKPDWLLEYPLWVAHYTAAANPATPGGRPWLIWQHRVGPYDPKGPGGYFSGGSPQLDQNRLGGVLPLVGVHGETPVGRQGDADGATDADLHAVARLAMAEVDDPIELDAAREERDEQIREGNGS